MILRFHLARPRHPLVDGDRLCHRWRSPGLILLFGKTVLLPLIGYTLFSWLAILAKNLHNFVGPLFAVCVIFLFVQLRPRQLSAAWATGSGSATSAGCSRATTRRRTDSTPARRLWFWGGAFVVRGQSWSARADSCSTFRISTRPARRCRSRTSCTRPARSCSCSAPRPHLHGHARHGWRVRRDAHRLRRRGPGRASIMSYWYNEVKSGKAHPGRHLRPRVRPRARGPRLKTTERH